MPPPPSSCVKTQTSKRIPPLLFSFVVCSRATIPIDRRHTDSASRRSYIFTPEISFPVKGDVRRYRGKTTIRNRLWFSTNGANKIREQPWFNPANVSVARCYSPVSCMHEIRASEFHRRKGKSANANVACG